MSEIAEKTAVLLRRYGVHVPVTDERFAGHADLERGTPLQVVFRPDERYGRVAAVTCAGVEVVRACPLTREKAAGIVDKLRRRGVLPALYQERATLTHLLVRCSELYLRENLERLELDPVYLRQNDYRIAGVQLVPQGPLHAEPRLEPHAHDKNAVFAHRR